ncbi:MAG: hypothetical protein CMK07_07810 [Ponticaulis sp.]|nr:hypothetical protein [Ponticaulis sp.]
MCFVLTVLCFLLIGGTSVYWNMPHLDAQILPSDIRDALEGYSPGQKEVHIWTTLTLDILLPLAYTGLLLGLTRRGFPNSDSWITYPALITLISDLAEGVVQVALLSGAGEGLVLIKSILTALKFSSFAIALVISVIALVRILRRPQSGS